MRSILRMPELRMELRQSLSSKVLMLLSKLMELYKPSAPGGVGASCSSLARPNTPALGMMR